MPSGQRAKPDTGFQLVAINATRLEVYVTATELATKLMPDEGLQYRPLAFHDLLLTFPGTVENYQYWATPIAMDVSATRMIMINLR